MSFMGVGSSLGALAFGGRLLAGVLGGGGQAALLVQVVGVLLHAGAHGAHAGGPRRAQAGGLGAGAGHAEEQAAAGQDVCGRGGGGRVRLGLRGLARGAQCGSTCNCHVLLQLRLQLASSPGGAPFSASSRMRQLRRCSRSACAATTPARSWRNELFQSAVMATTACAAGQTGQRQTRRQAGQGAGVTGWVAGALSRATWSQLQPPLQPCHPRCRGAPWSAVQRSAGGPCRLAAAGRAPAWRAPLARRRPGA